MLYHGVPLEWGLLAFVGVVAGCVDFERLGLDAGAGPPADGYERLGPETTYTPERGYGWVGGCERRAVRRGRDGARRHEFLTAEGPFWFDADVPEGNYRVTVALGDPEAATRTTVKAESRRLVCERVATDPGERRTEQFCVNVRNATLPGGGRVDLNDREEGALHWDDRLTLEFSDARPGLCALEVEPAPDATTVFLVGDSTVTDQSRPPWNSWGQMLTRFLGPDASVANHAESGRTTRSFVAERRWEKVASQLGAGDYLFAQFGHNDMKNGAPEETGYVDGLRRFVAETRDRDATPVLVTPPRRRRFDDDGSVVDTLGDYPDAVREVARDETAALVDLHAASETLYEALGPAGTAATFVDGTHHTDYGSYQLARCVVEGVRTAGLDLAAALRPDAGSCDPGDPTPVPTEWRVPDVDPCPHLSP